MPHRKARAARACATGCAAFRLFCASERQVLAFVIGRMFKTAGRCQFFGPDPRVFRKLVVPGQRLNAHGGPLGILRGKQARVEIRPKCRSADEQRTAGKQRKNQQAASGIGMHGAAHQTASVRQAWLGPG